MYNHYLQHKMEGEVNAEDVMNEKRICTLCGKEIVRGKGMNKKAHLYELQHSAHISCLRIQERILRKYKISSNDYLNALVEALFQLLPELEETKALKDYNSRARKAKEEIEKAFPHIKELEKREREKGEKGGGGK